MLIPIIKIAQLRKGKSDESDKCSSDIAEEYVIRDGDILFLDANNGILEVQVEEPTFQE